MANCVFCDIVNREVPCHEIYEDEHTLAFLDIGPVSKGHALVISKEHKEKVHELSDVSCEALGKALKKVSKAIQAAFRCDYNILCNNGVHSGQNVSHVHFHIIPRRGHPKEFSFDWPSTVYDVGKDLMYLKKIKDHLDKA